MRLYHILPAIALLLAAPASISGATAPIVFDQDSMTAHRLSGAAEVTLPAGAELPWESFAIEVDVTPEGTVAAARLSPDGPHSRADPAPALAAARGWHFRPFLYRGTPVAARGTIHIGFASADGWRDPSVPLPPIDYARLRIRLVRSACFGACPDYAVTIDGDGNILFSTREASLPGAAEVHRAYSPYGGVLLEGVHRARIDRATLDGLIERFRAAHFFGLRPDYQAGVTDNPTYALSFESGNRSFAVTDYVGAEVGMPHAVTELEDAVDAAAGTSRWVAGDAGTVPYLRGEGFDFRSSAAVQLAVVAARRDQASDRFVLDLIAAGVPLEQPFASERAPAVAAGEALLLNAVRRHRAPVVALLAERGWLSRIPRERLSAVFAEAAGGCDPEIARLLVAAGADPMARTPRRRPGEFDAGGKTALQLAVQPWGVCDRQPRGPLVAALVALGVDVNATDEDGQTALYGVENPELQEQLLAAGARADVHDKAGNSPVFSSSTDRIVLGLLDAGADPHGHYYDGYDLRREANEREMPAVLAWLDAHNIR